MDNVPDTGHPSVSHMAPRRLASAALPSLFLVLAALILTTAYFGYESYEQRYREQTEYQLSAIAGLKVAELVRWREERLADGNVLRTNMALSALVEVYLDTPSDAEARDQLQSWLVQIQTSLGYDRVVLLDTDGMQRLSSPDDSEPVDAHFAQDTADVVRTGQVGFLDLHREADDMLIHLAVLAPVQAPNGGVLGVIVLRIDPEDYLYPLINRWPVPSETAETLLVRRDGEDALFLNELRFQKDAALRLRLPLSQRDAPAVMAALGQTGIVEGVDYRGHPVIANVQPIPDSPWFLIARMDTAEVYAPLRERLWLTVVLVGLTLLSVGAAFALVGRRQSTQFYRQRYEAEVEKREGEARFHRTLDHMLEGCQILGFDWRYVYINDSAARHGRLPKEALLGHTIMQKYPGIEASDVFATLRLSMERRTAQSVETEFVYPDGTSAFFELSIQPVPEGIFILSIDISERKQSEARISHLNSVLRESEERYRKLVEMSPIAIYVDRGRRIEYANPACLALLGASSLDQIVGRSPFDLFHPDYHDIIRERVRLLSEGQVSVPLIEEKIIRFDGTVRDVEVVASPFTDLQGRAIQVVLQDITERKRAAEHLRRYAQRLASLNHLGRIIGSGLDLNRVYDTFVSELLALVPAERTSLVLLDDAGTRWKVARQWTHAEPAFMVGEWWPVEGSAVDWLVAHRAPFAEDEIGAQRVFRETPGLKREGLRSRLLLPLIVEERVAGILAVARYQPGGFTKEEQDTLTVIADHLAIALQNARLYEQAQRHATELEEHVRQRTTELEAANRELESFSYSVSHDLRAPLRAMDGFSRILLEDHAAELGDDAQRYLRLVRENAQQMADLIDDLLSLSRLGRHPLNRQRILPADVVQAVLPLCRIAEESREMDIVVGDMPPCQADPTLLRQVYINLLSNALKYTRSRDRAHIEVGYEEHEGEVAYFVRDDGVGFDMQYAHKLFGVFQRLHRAEDYEGTGVGLAIVQRIVNRHGGRVWAEAEAGRGATFYFTLGREIGDDE